MLNDSVATLKRHFSRLPRWLAEHVAAPQDTLYTHVRQLARSEWGRLRALYTWLLGYSRYGPSASSRSPQCALEGTLVLVQRLSRKDFHVERQRRPSSALSAYFSPLFSCSARFFPLFFSALLNKYLNKKKKKYSPFVSPCFFPKRRTVSLESILLSPSRRSSTPSLIIYVTSDLWRSFCH